MATNKLMSAHDAVQLIKDNDTIVTGGFVGVGFAESIAIALEKRFIETNTPHQLTLVYAAGQGDGQDRGLNHLAYTGLLKRVIGGHWGLVPKLQNLAVNNQIEAYNLPQGIITHLLRDIAAGKPGTLSHVGLGTFVDPRLNGGKINLKSQENLVSLLPIDGKEYLFYKAFPIHIGIIRATTADTDGNLTMEKEALTLEAQTIAMAAHNSGGIVIAQVERVVEAGTLNPREVKIPGILVNTIVVAQSPEHHMQTFAEPYNAAFSSEVKLPISEHSPFPMSARKIIARRAVLELTKDAVVNLGIGMPEGIASIAAEEGVTNFFTLTTEAGAIGGTPLSGLNFGVSINAQAIIDQPNQFDFYDGGGLDIAFLGLAQADREGNINVSKFGSQLAGAGGFINISQNAKKVVFVGTFTTGALKIAVEHGQLHILTEGHTTKFIPYVEHLTFSASQAVKSRKTVLYITERCVFELTEKGLLLIEIAPGIIMERDIFPHMAFKPIVDVPPKIMDARIFSDETMNLYSDMMA